MPASETSLQKKKKKTSPTNHSTNQQNRTKWSKPKIHIVEDADMLCGKNNKNNLNNKLWLSAEIS